MLKLEYLAVLIFVSGAVALVLYQGAWHCFFRSQPNAQGERPALHTFLGGFMLMASFILLAHVQLLK